MVDSVYYLISLLCFDVLYYYVNIRLSIIFCLFSGDVCLFIGISVSLLTFTWIILWWTFWNFCNFISNFITKEITSFFSYFLNCLLFFEAVLSVLVTNCLEWSRSFKYIYCYVFARALTKSFTRIFSKKEKIIVFYKYFISRLKWMAPRY